MRRDTLASLEQLLVAYTQFRKYLPRRAHPRLESLEAGIRKKWTLRKRTTWCPRKTVKHPSRFASLRSSAFRSRLVSSLPRRPIMRRRLFLRIPLVLFLLLVPFHNRAVTESPWSTSGEKATMFLTARTFPVGGSRSSSPESVVVEDFNGDGKLDTVTANFGTNNVSVLLGDGNGTFQAAVNY